jgi:SAM-dependent methyltransferase
MSQQSNAEGFNALYSETYDWVYQNKDYGTEVDAVFRLLDKHHSGKVGSLLDLGCGTGRHATLLAQRGLQVTGVDRSETMLIRARQRIAALEPLQKVDFVQADLRTLRLDRKYDVAVMMFNVLGYLADNDGFLATLRSVRRHLDEGHLFVFDFWYGPAVVGDPPQDRIKEFAVDGDRLKRTTMTLHRPHDQRCDISIRLQRTGRVTEDSTEHHSVRYFFPLELDLALRAAGFDLQAMYRFPDIDDAPNTSDWGVVAVARATATAEAAAP